MQLIATLPSTYSALIEDAKANLEQSSIIVLERKDIGGEQVVQWILEYGPDAIEALVTLYNLAKSENKTRKIKIDGVEYEYESREQLEEIIKKHRELDD